MASGVYVIRNTVNDHCYIGSAVRLDARLRHHRDSLKRGDHHSVVLQRAWALHGEAAFEFRVLLHCSAGNLIFYEQRSMDAYSPLYNISKVAGSCLGVKRSDETKALWSKQRRETPRTPGQLQHLANLTEKKRGKAGPKHTPETREKIRLLRTGTTMSQESSAKKSAATKGRPKSDEHKAKIGAGNKGKKKVFTAEWRANIAASMRGRKQSPESIAKMAASKTGKKLSPASLQARRERMAARHKVSDH